MGLGPPDLPQGRGGHGPHQLRQGVDRLQLLGQQVGHSLAVGAGGVVVELDAPDLPGPVRRRGVGVERQVKVEFPGVGLLNGRGGGFVRIVAHHADAAGQKIRLHGVSQPVHPVFLVLPGDIGIELLGRGTQE